MTGYDPNTDETPCDACGHGMWFHRKHWCEWDDCDCRPVDMRGPVDNESA